MARRARSHNLIKFSLYSTCVILPKNLLDELGWKQGDAVAFELDRSKTKLVIRHDTKIDHLRSAQLTDESSIPEPTQKVEPAIGDPSTPTISEQTDEDVMPIPEIS